METIQVVLDTKLLQAADRAARHTKQNRSALIRDALREHLRRLSLLALEERDREGYRKSPRAQDDSLIWEVEAAWPAEFRSRLAARGHDVGQGGVAEFGAAQIIWRLGDDGYAAASESRRDGQAVGF